METYVGLLWTLKSIMRSKKETQKFRPLSKESVRENLTICQRVGDSLCHPTWAINYYFDKVLSSGRFFPFLLRSLTNLFVITEYAEIQVTGFIPDVNGGISSHFLWFTSLEFRRPNMVLWLLYIYVCTSLPPTFHRTI
jgi:hypothetical protein